MKILTLGALALAGIVGATYVSQGEKGQGSRTLRAQLTPAAVRPGPGTEGASGTATLRLEVGQERVCYTLSVAGTQRPSSAHVHLGEASRSGPVVLTLGTPAQGSAEGCLDTNRALVRDLIEAPADYYVDVHDAANADGAVRGQLTK